MHQLHGQNLPGVFDTFQSAILIYLHVEIL